MAAIWNIVIWLHLSELLSGWCQIWYEEAESLTDTGHVIKIANFNNSRWRRHAILKMLISSISGNKTAKINVKN